jgi:hypothetical protein
VNPIKITNCEGTRRTKRGWIKTSKYLHSSLSG